MEARVPKWAAKAGIPPPQPKESFDDYVKRLGLNPGLFYDCDENRNLANMHLAMYLTTNFPSYFQSYMEERRKSRWYTPTNEI